MEEFKNNPLTRNLVTSKLEAHLYSGFAYDAVWTIAYALDRTERELIQRGSTLTLEDFEYFEANNLSNTIARHLARTNFSGVSVSIPTYMYTGSTRIDPWGLNIHHTCPYLQGPVLFDKNGTRTGLTGIYQLSKVSTVATVTVTFTITVFVHSERHTHTH